MTLCSRALDLEHCSLSGWPFDSGRHSLSYNRHHVAILLSKETEALYYISGMMGCYCSEYKKNILTSRKESDTYLATVSRDRWSRQIMMKINKI